MTNLREVQSKTILNMVNDLYERREFVNAPKKKIQKGDTIIGKNGEGIMTDYEKALYSASTLLLKEKNILINEAKFREEQVDVLEIDLYNQLSSSFDNLLWTNIQYRLRKFITNEFNAFAMRDGYQIVGFYEEIPESVAPQEQELMFIRDNPYSEEVFCIAIPPASNNSVH